MIAQLVVLPANITVVSMKLCLNIRATAWEQIPDLYTGVPLGAAEGFDTDCMWMIPVDNSSFPILRIASDLPYPPETRREFLTGFKQRSSQSMWSIYNYAAI